VTGTPDDHATAPDGDDLVLGVDVGGTFTDLVLAGARDTHVAKVPSTPQDQAEGILTGTDRLQVEVGRLTRFVHGTTVATNTVLERDGARTVLVTTAGFRDLLAIARQDRPHLYDLGGRRPAPVIEGALVVEARERIGADGEVVTELTDEEVARVVEAVRELEPEAVAVCLLFGFLVPDHERRLEEALRELDVPVTAASSLLPVLREVERTSTATLNAYVAPRLHRYLGSLERRLGDAGLVPAVEVMRSGGGTFTARIAGREPVHTLLSGPAAGAWGAAALGRAVGSSELIAVDVGGTSTDVTLISGGRPATTADGAVGGLPFAVTTTDIHTIGAGGGSLAWRDAGGALRVGPRSAGAEPGPACYGRGGEEPTVTDANVVLGRLDPDVRLGGAMPLRADLAERAVAGLAAELGLDTVDCAEGIVRVTDAQMGKALRVVSVERGRDPRRFALVAFGGAGPLHQAALAAELGCHQVLVPPNPGVLSAQGLLAAPVTVDRARSRVVADHALDAAWLDEGWEELRAEAVAVLEEQGVEVAATHPTADLRYRGQAFELEIPAPGADGGRSDPTALIDAFHAAHLDRYGYDQRGEDVELVTLRVRVEAPAPELPLPELTGGGDVEAAALARRDVVLDGETVRATVVDRSRLGAGAALDGPLVVVGLDATVWVAPWQTGEVDPHGVLVLAAR
jgi:N-methylhydantoinase A